VEDIVLIREGQREAGKIPSRSVPLHAEIYRQHPDVKSVLVAHPPNMMAFAVTDAAFDSRTIPESYILLRQIAKVPFGVSFMDPDLVARAISKRPQW